MGIKEMQEPREMKETEEWLEKMDPQVLLVFQEKWVHEDSQDLEVSMVFQVHQVFQGLKELQGLKEMKVQLVLQGAQD